MELNFKPIYSSNEVEKINILNQVLNQNNIQTCVHDNIIGQVIYVNINDYSKALDVGMEFILKNNIKNVCWITPQKNIKKIEDIKIIKGEYDCLEM